MAEDARGRGVNCRLDEPAAKSPACTVEVSPGRVAVPTSVQCVPSAESYPVIVPPSRTSRSQRGADADTLPGQAGRVVDVVPLHPHAVGPGDHHRRVRRALRRVLLDDDPGLGPRLQAGPIWGRAVAGRADGDLAGQRRHLHGDRAVPRHRLVREVERVLDRHTARPGRLRRTGARWLRWPRDARAADVSWRGTTKAVIATIVTSTAITQPRTVRNLVHSACTRCQKLSRSGVNRGAVRRHGPRRHDVASARYSTLWLVSSM